MTRDIIVYESSGTTRMEKRKWYKLRETEDARGGENGARGEVGGNSSACGCIRTNCYEQVYTYAPKPHGERKEENEVVVPSTRESASKFPQTPTVHLEFLVHEENVQWKTTLLTHISSFCAAKSCNGRRQLRTAIKLRIARLIALLLRTTLLFTLCYFRKASQTIFLLKNV